MTAKSGYCKDRSSETSLTQSEIVPFLKLNIEITRQQKKLEVLIEQHLQGKIALRLHDAVRSLASTKQS